MYKIFNEDDPDSAKIWETTKYLQRAYQHYFQFIILCGYAADVLLVPMNDVNIRWDMYLRCTTEYSHDCAVLNNGRLVPHVPIQVEDRRLESIAEEEKLGLNVEVIEPSIMEGS